MKRRGKKALEEEVKKDIKEHKDPLRHFISYPDMNLLLGNMLNQYPQNIRHKLMQTVEKSMKNGVDYDYLKAILFPEMFNSDIPQPYTNISYCRFSDRSNVQVPTGKNGGGTLLWYPKTNCGASLYFLPSDAPTYPSFPDSFSAATGTASSLLQLGLSQDYSTYFTQCNLVAASIQMQYTGQLEQESGIVVGSQVYGINPNLLILDDIENGQYVTRARPSEGIRFVYLPSENTDYDLYPCIRTNTHNCGATPTGNEQNGTITYSIGTAATDHKFLDGVNLTGGTSIPTNMSNVFIANNTQIYNKNTNYVAIYWSGVQPLSMWFRIDVMRRFIGIPKSAYRDIVELVRSKKNFDSKKTFDILRTLCINAPVGGHTLKDLDKHQEGLVDGVMNANEAIHLGYVQGLQSLGDLDNSLHMSNEHAKGLTGNFGQTSRIYPYSI